MLKIAYSPIYIYELPDGHRFPMEKYELIPAQLLHEGTVSQENFFHPTALNDEEILLTHTAEYLDKLKTQNLSRKEIRAIGFPMSSKLIERGRYIANGTLQCARYAIKHGVAMNIAGGTHHSFADHGEGFCIYNDIAIASNILLKEGVFNKILIVDLDVHQGNGTAKIFENEPRVFTFSLHGAKNYPLRKDQSDLDIGLEDNTTDELYLSTLKDTLPKLIEQVKPQIVFYLSGVDILETDKLGRLSVSIEGCKERDRFVLQTCRDLNLPLCISMGGGYSPAIRHIIEAHANTFRLANDIFF
ncbi:histone deacetylase family protein [Arcticibacterium luteifluviistationis]|uniref:Histone deacetylase n=1 Tax=Arcticibacterium luteifluviistationis TaxID=1784714 RepID=A0A2Z4GG00_9BACT|nr:histone deacetylase [Arcticibacterium luteifluviistationis]AWV99987.1 histone deacetylase [Arcticibacterium luteifluviistationis]